MKVVEHLAQADRTLISFEIIPPLRGGDVKGILGVIDDLLPFEPPFIDITSHGAQVVYEETPEGIQRKIKRKRPGTLGVCALIQNKYDIDAVPHLLCEGFTREETEDFLIELRYLGIDNVLAIRGDDQGYRKPLSFGRSANRYASDLVRQISSMNQGVYLEDLLDAEPSDFCVGVAGYPEKHFEAPNLRTDVRFTKEKVEAGAEYIVTQMVFDNKRYFEYLDECHAADIHVPVIPGLKVLTRKRHINSIPRTFHVGIPTELADPALEAKTDDEVLEIGIEWAAQQAEELLNARVPAIHFYVMQSANAVRRVLQRVSL